MSMQIRFDVNHNPEKPTIILAKRNGVKIGQLPVDEKSINISDDLQNANEISFTIYKEQNGEKYQYWDDIKVFRTAWVREYDTWFELDVDTKASTDTEKQITGIQLGHAELSQTMIYNFEVNTEDDIARDDYTWNYLYNASDPSNSILHRLMSKAPHYTIAYISDSLKKEGTQFEFDGESLYDCLQKIAKEIGFYIYIPSNTNPDGSINRSIYIYDSMTRCAECGYRGDYTDTCPECGSTNVISPEYGEDTTIFISIDKLADSITYSSNKDEVKNCFTVEGGDDLINATVRNCNPNGTNELWFITDDMKSDMSSSLVSRIESYNTLYEYYTKTYGIMLDSSTLSTYNAIVNRYISYKDDLKTISNPIVGYAELMNAYYNTIDLELFLQSELMPSVSISSTSASAEAAKLTVANIGVVATNNLSSTSQATANNLVLAMAKVLIDSRYQVKVNTSSYNTSTHVWTGNFKVTNYSDDTDTATSSSISITLSNNYASYVENQIKKAMNQSAINEDLESYDIKSLFALSYSSFVSELKKYCLSRLESFLSAGQACINILIEQGIANQDSWDGQNPNLYNDLYTPYYNKVQAIISEINRRETEIAVITGTFDSLGGKLTDGVQTYIETVANNIRNTLNFEDYLGSTLWKEFCAFRREDKYINENYTSDGLNNRQLFALSQELINVAKNEIYKSAVLQHNIQASLKDLLLTPKFSALLDKFAVGNWIRIEIDDRIYKLRLIRYQISFNNLNDIDVEFSDVIISSNGMSDAESLMNNIASLSTSYPSTKRNAKNGEKGNTQLAHWVSDGLALTKVKIIDSADNQNVSWDEHGILCRRYNYETDGYDAKQLKIINSGLYVTNDSWVTSKAGIGNFVFWNPQTKQLEEAYGVIADTLVGNLILSQEVGIYNMAGSVQIKEDGISIIADGYSGSNTMKFSIGRTTNASGTNVDEVLYIDTNGNLVGKFKNLTITGTGGNVLTDSQIEGLLDDLEEELESQIDAKIETWCQNTNPASAWSTVQLKSEHNGDLWYYTGLSNLTIDGVTIKPSKTYKYNSSTGKWSEYNSPSTSLFDFADGKTTIYYGTTSGTYANKEVGDYLVDSTDGCTYQWNGSQWTKVTDYKTKIDDSITYYDTYTLTQTKVFNKLTNNGALQGIFMDNNQLYVNASYVKTGVLNSIVIQNGTAVSGVYPFSVDANGNMVANSATVKGNITATTLLVGDTSTSNYMTYNSSNGLVVHGSIYANDGNIGGWTITNDDFYKDSAEPSGSGTQYEVWLYAPTSPSASTYAIRTRYREYENGVAGSWVTPFYVRYDGKLYANDVEIRGVVNATSGYIGNFVLTNTALYSRSTVVNGYQYHAGINCYNDSYTNYAIQIAYRTYDGNNYSSWVRPFFVTYGGYVYASDLHIRGGSIDISTSADTDDKIILKNTTATTVYNSDGTAVSKNVTLSTAMQPKGMTMYENYIRNVNAQNNVGAYGKYQAHILGYFVNGYDDNPVVQLAVGYSHTNGYRGMLTMIKGRHTERLISIGEGTTACGWIAVHNANGNTTAYLDGDGGVCAAYSWSTLSDRNKKKYITYLDSKESAEIIYKLKPAKFKYKKPNDDVYHHGLIAQDVEEILDGINWGIVSETVSGRIGLDDGEKDIDEQSYKTLIYTEFIADIIATIQLQHEEIEYLKEQISQFISQSSAVG